MTEPLAMTCAEVEDLAGVYVLGALDEAETAAVAAHLATCPEAHETYAELAAAGSSLAESVDPVDAPAGTRESIMAAIATTPQDATIGAALPPATDDATSASEPTDEPTRPIPPTVSGEPQPGWRERLEDALSGDGRLGWVALGAIVVALLFVGVGIVGTLQLTSDDADRLDLFRQGATAAADGSETVAVLTGSGSAEGAIGYAVFPDGSEPYVVIDGLDPAGPGETYQAWFIADGPPVSGGLLDVGDDGLAVLTGVSSSPAGPALVALTLEALPGAEQPTTDPIMVGEVESAVA